MKPPVPKTPESASETVAMVVRRHAFVSCMTFPDLTRACASRLLSDTEVPSSERRRVSIRVLGSRGSDLVPSDRIILDW